MITKCIKKKLSKNATGETGSHQAGIAVPKDIKILSFFPDLDSTELNPRIMIKFADSFGNNWNFTFVYYNNKFFGGTRNEYRLTSTTGFIRKYNLESGDEITFKRDENNYYSIDFIRKNDHSTSSEDFLVIGTSWRTVRI